MAHDATNPAFIISSKARLLLKNYSEQMCEKVAKDLEKIAKQADRLGRLTGKLLEMARPASAPATPLDLREAIESVLDLLEERSIRQAVAMELDLCTRPVVVKMDRDAAEQVLLNLFTNALDSMPEGGVLRVSTSCEDNPEAPTGEFHLVRIEDTGTGMPQEVLDQVFSPFFTTKEDGTGLGLSIAQDLLASAGGQIRIQSRTDGGTLIEIRLPVHREEGNG